MLTFGYLGRTEQGTGVAIVRILDSGERIVYVVICGDLNALTAWLEMHRQVSFSCLAPSTFKQAFLSDVPV